MDRLSFSQEEGALKRVFEKLGIEPNIIEIRNTQRGSVIIGAQQKHKFAIKIAFKNIEETEKNIVPARSAGLYNEIEVLAALADRGPFPRVISRLSSPSVNACVFEYIEGTNGFEIPIGLRTNAVRALFLTLHKLHALGYTHGDVQPNNLIFDSRSVFLIDFELASPLNMASLGYPGKREYLSPESANEVLLQGYITTPLQQDIYGLGMTALSILEGKEVSRVLGPTVSRTEKLKKISKREIEINIHTTENHPDPDLARAILQIIFKPESERPKTVDEFALEIGFALPKS